jgi:hypothetical protein
VKITRVCLGKIEKFNVIVMLGDNDHIGDAVFSSSREPVDATQFEKIRLTPQEGCFKIT